MKNASSYVLPLVCALAGLTACSDSGTNSTPLDPDTAPVASIDRFSADAGNLFVRDGSNGLPAANAAIDFDVAPFITQGLGPNGEVVKYYNFDVQPTVPAPIYVLFRDGETTPVAGQLNIVDVIPGEAGYSDFWNVKKVTVPPGYVANTITSVDDVLEGGYGIESTTTVVNCPVVPDGSTATLRYGSGSNGLVRGWYKDRVVTYFAFEEKALEIVGGLVPLSPIYVSFNINIDQTGGGPPSGFVAESGTAQTHNVLATIPADATYAPLWSVNAYDNADFGAVSNLATAQAANIMGSGIAKVNCPVVSVE